MNTVYKYNINSYYNPQLSQFKTHLMFSVLFSEKGNTRKQFEFIGISI